MQLLSAPPVPYHQLYFMHFQNMEDNRLIILFVWVVIIDIITGFAKSIVTKRTTSTKGTAGLIKHGILIIVILTLYPMLDVNGMGNAGDAFVSFYVLYYAVSILENWGQMGLPLPSWIKPYIYKLSDDYKKAKNHIIFNHGYHFGSLFYCTENYA